MADLPRQGEGDQGRDRREHRRPEPHRARPWRSALTPAAAQGRSAGLHNAVADHPQAHEAPHLPEPPAERGPQEHRQGHHEPHVAGAEQKEARQRKDVDAFAAGEKGAEAGFALHPPEIGGQHQGEQEGEHKARGHCGDSPAEAERRQQDAAEEEAHTLEGVLGTGEDRHPAEQLVVVGLLVTAASARRPIALCCGQRRLDGALGAHLVEVLGDAAQGLGRHHVAHRQQLRPAGGHRHQHQQGQDLQEGAGPQGEAQSEARRQPAAGEVGDDAEELVEEKQEGDLEAGVAELVEMEHHQHAQGAIGEGEGPVVGRHHPVLLQRRQLRALHRAAPCDRPDPPCGSCSPTRCRTRRRP